MNTTDLSKIIVNLFEIRDLKQNGERAETVRDWTGESFS